MEVLLCCRFAFFSNDGAQRELSAVINLGDFDQDFLSHREHIFDIVHSLATGKLANFGDVQQSIFTRHQGDERAEGCDLDDRSQVLLAHLGVYRVSDRVDASSGCFSAVTINSSDEHGAIIIDRDLSTGLILNRVDCFALCPINSPILSAGI